MDKIYVLINTRETTQLMILDKGEISARVDDVRGYDPQDGTFFAYLSAFHKMLCDEQNCQTYEVKIFFEEEEVKREIEYKKSEIKMIEESLNNG